MFQGVRFPHKLGDWRATASETKPGEPERRARAERLASGIPIDVTTWEQILASGEQVGLARADLEAIAG